MTDITITNQLDQAFTVYDSYQATDADGNYYGTLTSLSALAANGSVSIPPPHPLSTLIVFDAANKPLTRLQAGLSLFSFTLSDADVQAMAQADAFVTYVGANPGSPEAQAIHGMKAAADIDAWFKTQPSYALVTTPLYLLALTYRAQNPAPAGTPPQSVTYSLSRLITSITGLDWPAGMPDISISNFFFQDSGGVLQFGGTVDLSGGVPFDPALSSIITGLVGATGPVNVKVSFDTNIGLNLAGTMLTFTHAEIDVPLGGGDTLKIVKPTVSLTINPAFKFVLFEVQADFPLSVFGQALDPHLSMIVDNVEIEVGLDVPPPLPALPAPPPLTGVHFDSFGIGMGLTFEPPGYALGLQGAFHVGEGAGVVALDDDTFVVVVDLEGDVPTPMYLSFYIPKLDLGTVLTALTDVTVDVDVPVTFEDLSFSWSENPMEPVALPDGTMSAPGYGFSAYVDLFGLTGYADAQLNLTGVTVDAQLAPLDLAGIFQLTGKGTAVSLKFDAQGNPIRNNVIAKTAAERAAIAAATSKVVVPAGGPELHVSTAAAPYVQVDADATLLGVTLASLDVTVDDSGLQFSMGLPLATVACQMSTTGDLSGSFAYGPDWTIPLPSPLGSIHLQAQVQFSFSLAVTEANGTTTVTFTASGGFAFMGIPLTFGPVSLAVNLTSLEELVSACESYVVGAATSIFGPILDDALTWAKGVVNGAIAEVDVIASGLQSFFTQSLDEAAQTLQGAGVALEDAAGQLKDVYDAAADELSSALTGPFGVAAAPMAGLLSTLGFPALAIGGALSSVFDVGPQAAGEILQGLDLPAEEIGQVLQQAFGLGPGPAADVLEGLGYPIGVIASALQGVFDLAPDAIGGVLQSIGVSAQDVASAFSSLGGDFADAGQAILGGLETVGHALDPENW